MKERTDARRCLLVLALLGMSACSKPKPLVKSMTPNGDSDRGSQRELTHEETLAWIDEHRAWRRARNVKPIWARAVSPAEIGKDFQTADHAIEKAREGYWLCVGGAHEPWFRSLEKIEAKFDRGGVQKMQFAFDEQPRDYCEFAPKSGVVNWAAHVVGPNLAGFSIRPAYAPSEQLHTAAGGYVVKGDVADPYHDKPDDIWLVPGPLFESTYEFAE